MRSGCVLFLPTSVSAWCCSSSAASAHMSGTLRSMRMGRSRPMSRLTSLAYSTACGSPLEPSCAKAVTSHLGRSEKSMTARFFLTKNNWCIYNLECKCALSHFTETAYRVYLQMPFCNCALTKCIFSYASSAFLGRPYWTVFRSNT